MCRGSLRLCFACLFPSRSSKTTHASAADDKSGDSSKLSKSGFELDMSPAEIEAAKARLTKFQKYVIFEKGTERAFTGETINGYKHDNKEKG